MRTLMKVALVSSFFFATTAARAGEPVRLLETSPQNAKVLIESFPSQINRVTDETILVPESLVGQLSGKLHEATGRCGGFIDVTNESSKPRIRIAARDPLPRLGGKDPVIASMVSSVRADNLRGFVNMYSGKFKTRHARSKEGEEAPKWLREGWAKMAERAGRSDVKVELVPGAYNQNSVRITIPGKDASAPIVVLGAHLDSITLQGGATAPGADDDASGISALTEAYRVLLASDFHPNRTVQIFGYAAEELGLLGSRVIAEHYSQKGYKVRGALQLDMVAFAGKSKAVTFMTDYVDKQLTLWTEQVYGTYVGGPVKEDRCGYACSDHASWTRYNYPSVMPFESPFDEMNQRIHTTRDLWDELLDADYAAQFAKLAVAYAAELSN